MAVRWAVANGNWNATGTWNGGVLPSSGDDVYLNNHTVTVNTNINIGNGTIHNGANTDYGIVAGGSLTINTARNIIANLSQESGVLINMTTRYYDNGLVIVGNVKNTNNLLISCASGTDYHLFSIIINGNLEVNANLINSSFGTTGYEMKYFQVVGNVTINRGSSLYMSYNKPFCITNLDIIGTLTTTGNNRTICTEFNINGHISYQAKNIGVAFCQINILNPDTFTWKDLTEPRSNPFIILTDAEMNNRQQYPPENEVKEGVEYVWGEKIGTYQQPPESVVLKDYEYDTITAEENDIATYNLVRYIYATYGTLHWFELKTTTTDIVTDPTQQSISIDGETVVADTDYVVEYNDACYQWSGSAWASITTKDIGAVKTDIVTNPTETTLGVKKGTLETIPQATLSRMQNALTVDIFQQILDAHLNN